MSYFGKGYYNSIAEGGFSDIVKWTKIGTSKTT
jgi:hypothetical protein